MKATDAKVIMLKDGPYEVRGEVPMSRQIIVTDEKGGSVGWKEGEHHLGARRRPPLRSLLEEAVLRRHPQEDPLRRYRNGEPRRIP